MTVGQTIARLGVEQLEAGGTVPEKFLASCDAPESVIVRKPHAMEGLEVWKVNNSARYYAMYHTAYSFCAVERLGGPQTWTYQRRQYAMQPDAIMTIEPGEIHVTTQVHPSDYHVLFVEPSLVQRELGADLLGLSCGQFREGQIVDAELVASFASVWRALECETSSLIDVQHALRRFLMSAYCRAGSALEPRRVPILSREVKRAREFLDAMYAEEIMLDDVSQAAGVSKYYLERGFGATYGLPVCAYLKKVRVARARQLVAGGARPTDVAPMTGFCDQAHMTRVFRQELGFTPGEYARACRAR